MKYRIVTVRNREGRIGFGTERFKRSFFSPFRGKWHPDYNFFYTQLEAEAVIEDWTKKTGKVVKEYEV